MINQDEIKPSDIAAHLVMLPNMNLKSAWQLLDPADDPQMISNESHVVPNEDGS
jgi:hypothetical protein